MYAFFSGLANALCTRYNELYVGGPVLTYGVNVFIDNMPDKPAVAVAFLNDSKLRDPSSITRRPEFALACRAEKGAEGATAQLAERLYDILDRNANMVHGFPCLIRAVEEPVKVGLDAQSRSVFVSQFVLWGIKFT